MRPGEGRWGARALPTIRLALWLGVLGGLAALYLRAVEGTLRAARPQEALRDLLAEGGVLEQCQSFLLLAAVLVLLLPALSLPAPLRWPLALLASAAWFREQDFWLQGVLFPNAHNLLEGIALGTALLLLGHQRRSIPAALERLWQSPALTLFAVGGLLAISLSQVLGNSDVWRHVSAGAEEVARAVAEGTQGRGGTLDTEHSRLGKRFVEEGFESLAYCALFLGAVDLHVFGRRRRPAAAANAREAGGVRPLAAQD